MPNVNTVILAGHLTRDPELRALPGGTSVCSFGLAVNHTYATGSGEKKEEVLFIDVTFFGKRGEVIAQYFAKGGAILVQGRLRLETWETKEGQKVSRIKIVGEQFSFVGRTGKEVTSTQPQTTNAADMFAADDEIPF